MTDEPKRSRRIDSGGRLRLPRRDRWKNLLVDAIVCKPGVYEYRQRDGTIRRELKPADEIFSPAHMASVRDAAVTDEHPPNGAAVTPDNAQEFGRGHATGVERLDTDEMMVSLKVTDARLITSLDSKDKRGVSLGLDCVWDPTPGVWTDGTPYHGVQRAMITNQISVTGAPRIGGAEIRLDSEILLDTEDAVMVGPAPPAQTGQPMTTMKITVGDSFVDLEPGVGLVIQTRLAHLDSKVTDLTSQLTTETAAKDVALGKLDEAEAEAKKREGFTIDAADIPALFAARSLVLEGAALVLDSDTLKEVAGLSDAEVRKAVLVADKVDVTDLNDDRIQGRFDSMVEGRRSSAGDRLATAVAGRTPLHVANAPTERSDSDKDMLEKLAKIDSRHTTAVGGSRREA